MHSMLDCGILIVINKFCELQKIYNASFTSKYQLKEKKINQDAQIAAEEDQPKVQRVNFNFLELNPTKTLDVTQIAQVVGEQDAQIRRLDEADRAMQGDFTTLPHVGFCFDQFAQSLLLKPSTAESLIDLQAEFNELKIVSAPDDEEMSEVQQVSASWTLSKYYN